jgi:hypothetical protein
MDPGPDQGPGINPITAMRRRHRLIPSPPQPSPRRVGLGSYSERRRPPRILLRCPARRLCDGIVTGTLSRNSNALPHRPICRAGPFLDTSFLLLPSKTRADATDAIPIGSTVLVLNDMINAGLRRVNDEAHNRLISESLLIPNPVRMVAAAREKNIPIFWVRVERRPDRADVVDNLIDGPKHAWHTPTPPIVAGCMRQPMSMNCRSSRTIRSS